MRASRGVSAEADRFWMAAALEEAARAGARDEVPVGALVVRAERVIAGAGNLQRAAPDPSGHAEIRALRLAAARVANHRLPGTTLYVTLEPCVMCVGAVVHARVERVVFGCADPKAGALGGVIDLTEARCFNHRVVVAGGVRAEESAALLRAFFERRRA